MFDHDSDGSLSDNSDVSISKNQIVTSDDDFSVASDLSNRSGDPVDDVPGGDPWRTKNLLEVIDLAKDTNYGDLATMAKMQTTVGYLPSPRKDEKDTVPRSSILEGLQALGSVTESPAVAATSRKGLGAVQPSTASKSATTKPAEEEQKCHDKKPMTTSSSKATKFAERNERPRISQNNSGRRKSNSAITCISEGSFSIPSAGSNEKANKNKLLANLKRFMGVRDRASVVAK